MKTMSVNILMKNLMEVARDRGLEKMDGQVLGNNFKMLELIKSFNFRITADPDDTSVKQVEARLI